MKVLVLAASKGGVGKSTIATALAIAATKDGAKVAILDADPQQSIEVWRWLRTESGLDCPDVFAVSDIDLDIADLRDAGIDYCICDSGPGDVRRISLVVQRADLVIIPTRVSAWDLDAIKPAVEACEDLGKPFAFLLNAVGDTKGAVFNGMVKALGQNGPVLDQIVKQRAAYANAIALGLTGPEVANKAQAAACAEEIDALWQAVKRRLARSAAKARA